MKTFNCSRFSGEIQFLNVLLIRPLVLGYVRPSIAMHYFWCHLLRTWQKSKVHLLPWFRRTAWPHIRPLRPYKRPIQPTRPQAACTVCHPQDKFVNPWTIWALNFAHRSTPRWTNVFSQATECLKCFKTFLERFWSPSQLFAGTPAF